MKLFMTGHSREAKASEMWPIFYSNWSRRRQAHASFFLPNEADKQS